jgi:integrase
MSSQSDYPTVQAGNPALKLLDEEIVEGFLVSYGNERTRQSYRHCLSLFREWIATLPAGYRNFNLLTDYRAYLHSRIESEPAERRISAFSASLYMAVVKKYTKFLFEHGLLEHDPGENVKGFRRHSAHYRRALDRTTEMPRLFGAIDQSSDIGIRDYAIICLMAYTGIRAFELVAADYGDLDSIEGRPILWIRSKGKPGKSEYVFTTEQPYKALQSYLKRRRGLSAQSSLFVGTENGRLSYARMTVRAVQKRVNYWLKKAGLKSARITTHSLRHTAAVSALKNGADIRAVQGMLRHRDERTTLLYLRDISRQDNPAEDAVFYGDS